jgi:hypothetical protein
MIISHRGNVSGRIPASENNPMFVDDALNAGYDVEIDVWYDIDEWSLGHDEPVYDVEYEYLLNSRFWLHAKNGDAFHRLVRDVRCNVFWHTDEDWVLTSKQYIWTYPGKALYPGSICVLPELGMKGDIDMCAGICTDNCSSYDRYK